MKNKILFVFILVLFFSTFLKVSASNFCLSNGYSIFTINGIFTTEDEARDNKDRLKDHLQPNYNNQPLKVDFLYNPTHLSGAMDLVDVLRQMIIDDTSDFDMTEILDDASKKVSTQKLLLVGHSQGNFYANNLYDAVASKPGGVPKQSIGVYGVASPATRVAGGGKYLTTSSDRVINSLALKLVNNKILPSNINLSLQSVLDGSNGHSFSDTYLRYAGDRIVSDIKFSLNKLQNNDEQLPQDPCISPPELTPLHKVERVAFTAADFFTDKIKYSFVYIGNGIYNTGLAVKNAINGLLANAVESLPDPNAVTTILPNLSESENTNTESTETTPPQTQNEQEQTQTTNETTIITEPSSNNISQPVIPNVVFLGGGGGSNSGSGGSNDGGENPPAPDTIAPVITITGANPVDVTKDTVYTDLSATALDDIDGVITVIKTGSVDTSTLGTYTITYTATDLSNNIATKTRTVNVVSPPVFDTTAPVITIIGTDPVNVVKGMTYTDAGATATDETDGTRTVVTTGNVDTTTIGAYTITYTTNDLSNNTATLTRIVNVVADGTAPIITLVGNEIEMVRKNSVYTDAGATALDDVDGARVVTTTGVADVNTAVVGTYTVTYSANDLSNNTTTKTRTVIVDDGAKLNRPNHVAISGNYAYVVSEESNSLEIIDISNPTTLVHKSSAVHGVNGFDHFAPKGVAVSGNYAYVVSYSNNLEVVDISNPLLPVVKSILHNGDGGAQLVRPISIAISGNYAYIVSYGGQNIEIVDISDPIHPVHKSVYWLNGLTSPMSIFVSGNYAYVVFLIVGQNGGLLKILDISNPILPVSKGAINDGANGASISNPQSVFVSGNYAFIASRADNTLEIVDISDPLNPIHKGKITDGTNGATLMAPISVFVSGNYAYVVSFVGSTLEILDISDPANPIHKASLGNNIHNSALSYPKSVLVLDNYAYVSSNLSNALEIVDISDPANPIHKNKILNSEYEHTDPPYVPDSGPDITPPSITSYTFNGTAGDITTNPSINNISLALFSSENVNWMSIKIEKENDESVYKIFQSGTGCVDGTNTCAKTWDGLLSGGSTAPDGVYRIKVHIKDPSNNEFYDYLIPYKITVNTAG